MSQSLTLADLEMFRGLQIEPSLLERAGIVRVDAQEADREFGVNLLGDTGVAYPYFRPPNGTTPHRVSARVRHDHPPRDENGKLRKYECAWGDNRHLYFPPCEPAWIEDPATPVIFVEAEKSALALLAWCERHDRRLIPVGLGGCNNWRGRIGKTITPDGERVDEKGPLPDLEIARDRKAYVLFDSDVAHNDKVYAARERFVQALQELHADVYFLNLPGSGKEGPDDYLGARGDEAFFTVFETVERRACADSTQWKDKFHLVEELTGREVVHLIENVLPEGVAFLGGLSGAGKTWFALSLSRALITGQKFLGIFPVHEAQNVLYLVPEMGEATFKKRCVRMGIGGPRFRCQTLTDGTIDLAAPTLEVAVREFRPVIFLDTSIRFSNAESENSAAENRALARGIFALLRAGAKAVVCLHHRGKSNAKNDDQLTLENALRGTTDLGAIADVVFGLKYDSFNNHAYLKESRKLVRLDVCCVKSRDFPAPEDLRIQLFPFLDEIGDFGVLTDQPPQQQESDADRLAHTIEANRQASNVQLAKLTGISRNRINKLAAAAGWHYEPLVGWQQD